MFSCLLVCLQLLKYVPTSDEKNLLNAHNKEIEQFARADRFLYDMSRLEIRNWNNHLKLIPLFSS